MRNMNKQNKKGFTLVELVVVIAILGILAGIAIPRFMEANKAARGAKIVADMRTIESAVNIYYVTHGSYPADKDAPGFANIVNGGTWPTPPIGNFTISHTMGSTGDDPTSGTCTENTAYTYTIRDEDSLGDTVTLTDTTNLSNCADTTSPTVIELLTTGSISNPAFDATVENLSSLMDFYNSLTSSKPYYSYGGNFIYDFIASDTDRTVSDEFLAAYNIDTGFNDDLRWYADYNRSNDGTVLFLTTPTQFATPGADNMWSSVLVVTEDGTVYTSNATSSGKTTFSSIASKVNGDNIPNNGNTSEEIGVRLLENEQFTQQPEKLDI